MIICFSHTGISQTSQKDSVIQKAKSLFQSLVQIDVNTNNGTPRSIRGVLAKNININDVVQIKQFISNSKTLFRLNDMSDELVLKKVSTDNIGTTHAKLQQTYKGIPVWGSELILHSDASNTIVEINGRFTPDLKINIAPNISANNALNIALEDIGPAEYRWQNIEQENIIKTVFKNNSKTWRPIPELAIAPIGGDYEKGDYQLVWKMTIAVDGEKIGNYEYFVDAKNGKIINKYNSMPHANGISNYNGTVSFSTKYVSSTYQLFDETRSIKTYTANNSTSSPGNIVIDSDNYWDQNNSAVDVHWGTAKVYDYYLNIFSRNSFDNNGAEIISTVDYRFYCGSGCTTTNNAGWNGSQMLYGNGDGTAYSPLTTIDICGHELTHAVTQNEANLSYQYESGALNEALSDIFGTSIEFYSTPNKANWLIGEECYTPGTGGDALRYMNNPNSGGQPDTYLGTNWYSGSGDNGGVHTNSGVLNYAFYLMTVGGSGTNDANTSFDVTGIGITKTQAIAYRALTTYLTSSSNYAAARTSFLSATSDLYGSTSSEYQTVSDAFGAVGIGVKLIAKNNFDAGTIKVNSATVNSGYNYFITSGTSQTYEVIPQYYSPYDRVWNTTGVDGSLSYWKKQPSGGVSSRISGQTSMAYTFTPSTSDHKATYIADLMKRYNVSRNEQTDFDGTATNVASYQVVEQNSVSITAPTSKTVNSKDYRFYGWSDGNTSNPRSYLPTDNVTLTAQYKAHRYSTSSDATLGNGQRKVVKAIDGNGNYAMVYESGNKIWLTTSTDGSTWSNEVEVSYGSNFTKNKYPSLAISGNVIAVVWQSEDNHNEEFTIQLRRYDLYNNQLGAMEEVFTYWNGNDLGDVESKPVIAANWFNFDGSGDDMMVAWQVPTEGIYTNTRNTSYGYGWATPELVPGTTSYCGSPSISSVYWAGNYNYHLCWKDDYYDRISYTELNYDYQADDIQFYNAANISPSGWSDNNFPSIIYSPDYKVTVVWQAYDDAAEGYSVVVRQKSNGTWGNITSFSSGTSNQPHPVVGTYRYGSSTNRTEAVWTSGNYVYSSTNNGSSWSSPITVVSGANGGSDAAIIPHYYSSSDPGSILKMFKNSSNNIKTYIFGGLQKTDIAEGSTIKYRLNKHVLINLESIPELAEKGYKGMVAFEIAGLSHQTGNVGTKLNAKNENKDLRSGKISVSANSDVIKLAAAYYAKGLVIPENAKMNEIGNLIKVSIKDANTETILKDVWNIPFSKLASRTGKTDGEFREINIPLTGLINKDVYLDVKMTGDTQPIFVDDYFMFGKEDENMKKYFEETPAIITHYTLHQNYPNPFNPSTTIRFDLVEPKNVTLKIYNALGQEVKTLVNDYYSSGSHEVTLDASSFSSGTYFYRIIADKFSSTKSFMLIK